MIRYPDRTYISFRCIIRSSRSAIWRAILCFKWIIARFLKLKTMVLNDFCLKKELLMPLPGGGEGGAHLTKLESRNKRLGFCRKPECWQRWWLANLKWKIVPKLGSSTEVWAVSLRVIGTWDCQLQRSAGGTKTTWWLIFYDDVCHVICWRSLMGVNG